MNKVFGLNGLMSDLNQGTPLKHPATPYSEIHKDTIHFPSVNKLNHIKHKTIQNKMFFSPA